MKQVKLVSAVFMAVLLVSFLGCAGTSQKEGTGSMSTTVSSPPR